ncbi:MAG TPA: LysR family transcriptional regulator [Mycobacterium sp.]|nr:LysR family transcriptional regulator [Mycobacterium sp.]
MELRHLRSFVAVAEELHFGRAAERLHIAQSPLSQQIQRLERQVGATLFERNRRKVELTEAGHAMLRHAREALAQADLAENAARTAAAGRAGLLRVGFLGSAALAILPRIVPPWRATAPDVALRLVEGSSGEHIRAVHDQRLDVAFVRPPATTAGLVVYPVWHEPVVAVLPATSDLSRRERLRLRDLRDQPFVLFPRDSAPDFHDELTRACTRVGFTPAVAYECTAMPTVVGLVASGLGVALVPRSINSIGLDGVVYRELADAHPEARIAMVVSTTNDRPAVRHFIDSVIRLDLNSG